MLFTFYISCFKSSKNNAGFISFCNKRIAACYHTSKQILTKFIQVKKLLCFILLLSANIITIKLSAQNNNGIKGKILTANGEPAYVSVELQHQKKIKATDNKGNFQFSGIDETQDTLVISSVEFNTKKIAISFEKDKVTDLGTINLDAVVKQLQDIEVKGRITKSYKSDYSFLGNKTQTALIDIPQSVSTVTKELINDRMNFTFKDAADEIAGLNNYSGYDDYSIRGFKAENAKLINGLRGYNTTYVSPMLVNVERIEVIKGPSAVLYGNCDPGGTINMVTKKTVTANRRKYKYKCRNMESLSCRRRYYRCFKQQ